MLKLGIMLGRLKRGMGGAGRRAGFTLIELLIALSILAVGILATAALFPTGYTTVASSGNATMANAAAQQILEDLRSVDFVNLPVLNGRSEEHTSELQSPLNLV